MTPTGVASRVKLPCDRIIRFFPFPFLYLLAPNIEIVVP